jgi:hypothetical protein
MKAITCPTCSSTSIQERGKRYSLYPSGIVAIVGLPFALLHQVSAPQEFHCDSCGLDFAQRTLTARIARVFLFMFAIGLALLALLGIVGLILAHGP